MTRPYTPRAAFVLWGSALAIFFLGGVALLTDQPDGVWSLSLGLGMGLNVATSVMVNEVRKARRGG